MQIGFIGIGLMGFPMAKNLLKSGYKLKVFNRSQDKAEKLKEFGAEVSTSIKDVVTNSDIIITMLTDDVAVEKVMGSEEFIKNIFITKGTQLVAFCYKMLLVSSLFISLIKIYKGFIYYSVTTICWVISCKIPITRITWASPV